ncbi:hypothetical protein ACP46_gp03 [Rhizobium phage RHEph06]|uniref:Uncharacterized protein n=2 Tax=Kleczkowskavirus RHEph4 TaxID=1921526 RepID=L7TJJ6_9CAUD|nr:hypothetical protein ACP46_gp03 [Rhizobium phage RHEph06]YP_009598444.1 hypothetical protein FDH25_gp02 [Rhizobium phage RHEph04]AGC35688.1 hypothetical protein RHEph04_gp002 [Rhizobium phage RHEph04]AGC35845.1 hypothetical protein RHEph06_gp003 [Rhizobium phage RHEph06]QXV74880.1 hypothetical protein [Rhizobium phage RHEph26]
MNFEQLKKVLSNLIYGQTAAYRDDAIGELARYLAQQERRVDMLVKALPVKPQVEDSPLSAITLADKVEQSDAFRYLAQGMKDRYAFRIVSLIMLDGQAFADLENFCKEALEEQAKEIDLAEKVKALEQLRPVWAQGYGTAGVAANATSAALGQLWELLGVTNQTRAIEALNALKVQASLNGPAWRPEERLQLRNYSEQAEGYAFRAGYSDGWHGRPQDETENKRWPNAYSAGYWEGFADAGRKA